MNTKLNRAERWLPPTIVLGAAIVAAIQFTIVGLVPIFVEELRISLHEAAWLMSAFAISAGIVGPAVTFLFSRGRPYVTLPVILASFALTEIIAAMWPGYVLLLVIRFGQGALLTPFLGIASATAAALAKQGQAGRAIGRVPMGTVLGSVLAVPAALALANLYGWRTVFIGLGILALCAATAMRRTIPWDLPERSPKERQAKTLRTPHFAVHLLLTVLTFTAMFAAYTYIASFLEQVAHMVPTVAALALLAFGVAGIVGSWVASQVVERQPTVATLAMIALLVAVTCVLPLAARNPVLLMAVLVLWGAAHNAAFVACLVRVMFAAGEAPALGAAFNISAGNVGMALGALWGSQVISYAGIAWVGVGAAIAGLLALAVGWLLYKNVDSPTNRALSPTLRRRISARR